MGKGGGCVPSKNKRSKPTSAAISAAAPPEIPPEIEIKKVQIFIVFYSTYGHVETLAKAIKRGIDEIENSEAKLYRVEETLTAAELDRMKAPEKDLGIPVLSDPAELEKADGILFGFPARFGAMAAQMKAFFDSTAGLCREQRLAGKPAGFFVSTGSQGGGQETTAWTAITQLAHHGMLFVPIGYTFGSGMFRMDAVRGGSPYGAGTFSSDGSRQPTDAEIALAEHQGRYMAAIVKSLCLSSS